MGEQTLSSQHNDIKSYSLQVKKVGQWRFSRWYLYERDIKNLEKQEKVTHHTDSLSLPNNHLLVYLYIHLLSQYIQIYTASQTQLLFCRSKMGLFKLASPWQQLLPVEAGSLFLFCCVLFPMTKLLRETLQLLPVTTIKQQTALQTRLEGMCYVYSVCICNKDSGKNGIARIFVCMLKFYHLTFRCHNIAAPFSFHNIPACWESFFSLRFLV